MSATAMWSIMSFSVVCQNRQKKIPFWKQCSSCRCITKNNNRGAEFLKAKNRDKLLQLLLWLKKPELSQLVRSTKNRMVKSSSSFSLVFWASRLPIVVAMSQCWQCKHCFKVSFRDSTLSLFGRAVLLVNCTAFGFSARYLSFEMLGWASAELCFGELTSLFQHFGSKTTRSQSQVLPQVQNMSLKQKQPYEFKRTSFDSRREKGLSSGYTKDKLI